MSAAASFHPPEELLLAYAAGSLDEATALLMATHLTFCPHCRAEVARMEALGGGVLASLPPADMGASALAATLERLGDRPGRPPVRHVAADFGLPAPLRAYIPEGEENLAWRRVGRGIEQVMIVTSRNVRARLQRVAPGVVMPTHTHEGNEMTLVLRGGYVDGTLDYGPGDVAIADNDITHTPAADPIEGCLCLAVTDAPLRLTSFFGRMLNPFLDL